MKTVVVTTQAEWNALPASFSEFTTVEIRSDPKIEIVVRTIPTESQVRACDCSQVTACDSSQVPACDSSQVRAYDSSQVRAYGSSQVSAYDSSGVHVQSVNCVIDLGGFAVAMMLAKAKVKRRGKKTTVITP